MRMIVISLPSERKLEIKIKFPFLFSKNKQKILVCIKDFPLNANTQAFQLLVNNEENFKKNIEYKKKITIVLLRK